MENEKMNSKEKIKVILFFGFWISLIIILIVISENSSSSSSYSSSSSSSSSSSYSSSSYSSSSSYNTTKETCKYKSNGRYVCSEPATKGSLCYRHFKELDDTYKYFTSEEFEEDFKKRYEYNGK